MLALTVVRNGLSQGYLVGGEDRGSDRNRVTLDDRFDRGRPVDRRRRFRPAHERCFEDELQVDAGGLGWDPVPHGAALLLDVNGTARLAGGGREQFGIAGKRL